MPSKSKAKALKSGTEAGLRLRLSLSCRRGVALARSIRFHSLPLSSLSSIAMSSNDTKSQLAHAVVAWLRDANTQSGASDSAQLEQAAQSISAAFSLPSSSPSGPGLQTIFDVYLKTQSKLAGAGAAPAASASSSSSSAAPAAAASATKTATPEEIAQADQHKTDGNKSMSSKDYSSAIASYTKAIDLHPSPVFYSNRAAAYSQVGQHDRAIDDAREAAKLDPKFGKAYSRLGHALFSSGKYAEAVDAYQQGLLVDPENKLMKSGLETAQAQADKEGAGPSSAAATRDAPGAGAGAGAGGFGGFPGMGGGGGGMPDIASLMVSASVGVKLSRRLKLTPLSLYPRTQNNPQMAAMAQQMMSNGGLDQLMQNPMLRRMAESMGSGGGESAPPACPALASISKLTPLSL